MKTSTLLFSLTLAPLAAASDPVLGGAPGSLDLGPGTPGGSIEGLPHVVTVQAGESIQAALDHNLTRPGDTVLVMPGTYVENVVVRKPFITLRGRPGAVIQGGQVPDPEPSLDDGYLACIRVEADDVTVTGFTLAAGGFGVLGRAPAPPVGFNDPYNPDGDPVHRLTVTRNTIRGQRYDGVNILGDDAEVLGNTISHTRDEGVEYFAASTWSRTEISNNHFSHFGGICVRATNGQLICSGNRGDHSDYDLVRLEWDTSLGGGVPAPSLASGNQYHDSDGRVVYTKIKLDGVELLIEGNRKTGGYGGFFLDFHNTAGGDVTMRGNHIERVVTDAIYVRGSGVCRLEDNTILESANNGIELRDCVSYLVGNVIRDCTQAGIAAQQVSSSVFQGNDVRGCGQDGLVIDGSNNQIVANTFNGNGSDGIDIDKTGSTGNIVTGNTCLDNFHEGIDNTGTSTTIEDNSCHGNGAGLALDIAGTGDGGAGSVASFTGNVFTTGGMSMAGVLD